MARSWNVERGREGRCRRGVLLVGALLVAVLLAGLVSPASAEDPKPGETDAPEKKLARELWPQLTDYTGGPFDLHRTELEIKSGDVSRTFYGYVQRRFTVQGVEIWLRCDSLMVELPGLAEGLDLPGGDDEDKDEEGDQDEGSGNAEETTDRKVEFWFYAGGNVQVEIPSRRTSFVADSLYYDSREPLAVIRGAHVRTTVRGVDGFLNAVELGGLPSAEISRRLWEEADSPLAFSSKVFETRDFRTFESEEIRISTCDYGEPHFALAAKGATVTTHGPGSFGAIVSGSGEGAASPVTGPTGAGASEDSQLAGESYATIDFVESHFQLWGSKILPLGVSHWDTRWNDFLPIRRVDLGTSSKLGPHAGLHWNINFFLAQLPLDLVPAVEGLFQRSKLRYETIYMEKRGFGHGPYGEWGRSTRRWKPWQLRASDVHAWDYYGEGRWFTLRDHGEDRFGMAGAPPDESRHWLSVVHRQSVPYLGTVDAEYSELSDANFLPEYFETVAKEEKPQESLFSLRRNFTDNKAVTGLFKYRPNGFESTVERLPEAKFWMYQEPVFGTGLYADFFARAANLRVRPPDGVGDSRRFARADVFNEWAYPVDWLEPYVQLRPYTFARFTAYEEVLDPTSGSEDRFASGAGIVASQQWSRVFDLDPEGCLGLLLDGDALRHVIVPSVSYSNVFTNDLDPSDLIAIDTSHSGDVDAVALRETVSVSFAQAFFTRQRVFARPKNLRPEKPILGLRNVELEREDYRLWRFLDSDVRFMVFPHSGRDNANDFLSMLVLDNTLRVHERVSLRSWVGLDPNKSFRGRLIHNSVRTEVVPDVVSVTIGDIYADDPTGGDSTNRIFTLLSVYPGEKWRAQAYWQLDVEEGEDAEIAFNVGRVFHRFALLFEYSFDAGEDDNQTFSINFRPLDILGSEVFERGSRW